MLILIQSNDVTVEKFCLQCKLYASADSVIDNDWRWAILCENSMWKMRNARG